MTASATATATSTQSATATGACAELNWFRHQSPLLVTVLFPRRLVNLLEHAISHGYWHGNVYADGDW